ncbi:7-carboxy-7-deazaguanine synthase QueE [Candidatus Methylopumilus turicensis]|uniref:7-carboxy-7-deazaguanine synthase n=1 Tax=Candidatus Methylopumilus turicensis TaxID=1581680 RepID=A0A0B7IWR4_9PROT|nr:7-carboxy-7-deazaguanine synthase QueE [Candidatus Methylopumilus turicensis]CEN56631.1 7-carboxy-7-deazaguanine synthase [Candidatus Methylopumilus turicensis]
MSLRIFEIFHSLQGESSRVGLPTVFVRLTGCPLRCGYCDTEYAFHGGATQSFEEILAKVASYKAQYVCVTGGEPLAQKGCHQLLKMLCDAGYQVSIETSGAIDISQVDQRVSVIMDIKTPGSCEASKNLWSNVAALSAKDEVKFVLVDRADYDWAKQVIADYDLNSKCPVLFSPVYKTLPPDQLAAWVLQDHLRVRMQVQLHKVIWGEKAGV